MQGFYQYKVKGGKLIQCVVWCRGDRVDKVRFAGDFFMHPEDALEELEESLRGIDVASINNAVDRFFAKWDGEMFGVSAEDFAEVLLKAISQAGE